MSETQNTTSGKRRFPSYRQWKAWRAVRPSKAGVCFICGTLLAVFDGLATKRIVGGKAAAFGGNGRERVDWNKPDDKIKAGCTVKFKVLEQETVTPAHPITLMSGNTYTLPEKVERKYADKLMTVSVSGIGCELCRTLAMISERGYVDVSTLVGMMDPNDAPVQQDSVMPKGTKQQNPRGVVTLGRDNILRVKDPVVVEPFITYTAEEKKVSITSVPKPVDPLAGVYKRLNGTKEVKGSGLINSLLYWVSPKRKVSNRQSVQFIGNQAYNAARETVRLVRQIHHTSVDLTVQPERMYTPMEVLVGQ